jgi:uncharacterized membrane protein
MDTSFTTLLILRTIHILLGVFWAGTIIFFAIFMLPSLRDLGPDGAKVMGALQKRRYMEIMPAVALLTIITGFWLYWIVSGGFDPAYMGSRSGMLYGVGGVTAVLALLIGVTVIRSAAMRVGAIMQKLPQMPAGAERDALMVEVQRLRQRTGFGSSIVALLLIITVSLMAVTRYL